MQRGRVESATAITQWDASSSAIIDGRIWLERSPWRLAGGWSMLSALLSVGILDRLELLNLPQLLLLFLLVDLMWGSIWGSMTVPNSLPSLVHSSHRRRVWLPYLHPGSPAARLFGVDSPGILPVISRVAVPGIILSILISLTLHTTLFWLTLIVVALSIAGWLHRQIELMPVVLLHSLISVTMPWLATLIFYGNLEGEQWRDPLLLVVAWTFFLWGANRNLEASTDRFGLAAIALAQILISVQIILAQTPLWLALLGILWLPTWLAVYRDQPLRRVEFWWPAAMIVSAIAIGQTVLPV